MKQWLRASILLIPLIIAGCWDRREVNDIGIVMGTAIDYEKDINKIRATLQIAVPSATFQSSGGTSKETDSYFLITAVGKNGMEIEQKLQQKMSRKLFFSHRSVILIGESMARKGINEFLDTFSRNPRNRLRTYMYVVKGMKAGELFEARYPYELVSAEAMKEMQLMQGAGVSATLRDFLIASASEGGNPAIAVLESDKLFRSSVKKEDKQFRMSGTAIFKSSALAGFLNNKETHEYMWFTKNKITDNIVAVLPEGMGNVGLIVTGSKIKIEVVSEGDPFKFHVQIKAKGDLYENNTPLDVTQTKNIEMINKALEQQVKKNMESFLNKIQTDYKTDIVGFGQQLERKNPKRWRAVKDEWDRYFAQSDVSVSVKLTINNTGIVGPSLHWKEKEIVK